MTGVSGDSGGHHRCPKLIQAGLAAQIGQADGPSVEIGRW
jgi:hypothetical protein